jgi:hypothetical protein
MAKDSNKGESTGRGRPTRRSRVLKGFGNLALIVLTLLSVSYLYWVYVDDRFLTVVESNVFRTGEMDFLELLDFVDRHNIRTVIAFRTTPDRMRVEDDALTANGIRSIDIPVLPIPSDEVVDRFLGVMGDVSNYPVLLHYEQGVGRSSLFEAIFRIEYLGWSNDEARKVAMIRSVFGGFDTEDERGQYIMNYKPTLRRSLWTRLAANSAGDTRHGLGT